MRQWTLPSEKPKACFIWWSFLWFLRFKGNSQVKPIVPRSPVVLGWLSFHVENAEQYSLRARTYCQSLHYLLQHPPIKSSISRSTTFISAWKVVYQILRYHFINCLDGGQLWYSGEDAAPKRVWVTHELAAFSLVCESQNNIYLHNPLWNSEWEG